MDKKSIIDLLYLARNNSTNTNDILLFVIKNVDSQNLLLLNGKKMKIKDIAAINKFSTSKVSKSVNALVEQGVLKKIDTVFGNNTILLNPNWMNSMKWNEEGE